MTVLLLCYHSIAPCTSKGDISASAICHLWRFDFSFDVQVGLNTLPLATLVAYPKALIIEGTVNELEVVDSTLELSFHSSSVLFSVTEFIFLNSQGDQLFL